MRALSPAAQSAGHERLARGGGRRHGCQPRLNFAPHVRPDRRQTEREPLTATLGCRPGTGRARENPCQEPDARRSGRARRYSSPRRPYADGPATRPERGRAARGAAPGDDPRATVNGRPEGRTGVIPLGNDGLSLNVPPAIASIRRTKRAPIFKRANAPAPNGRHLRSARTRRSRHPRAAQGHRLSYDAIGYVHRDGVGPERRELRNASARRTAKRKTARSKASAAIRLQHRDALLGVGRRNRGAWRAGGKDCAMSRKYFGRNGRRLHDVDRQRRSDDKIAAAASDLRGMLSFPEGQRHGISKPHRTNSRPIRCRGSSPAYPRHKLWSPEMRRRRAARPNRVRRPLRLLPVDRARRRRARGVGYMLIRRRRDDDEEVA